MELDVRINQQSLSIPIENPFRLDVEAMVHTIDAFLAEHGEQGNNLDIASLLPRMVKGIAGCEAGCPSDALSVVRKGHQHFKMEYVEGGILTATASLKTGQKLALKLFPDF